MKVCRSKPASPQSGSSSAAAMCSILVIADSNSLSSLSKCSTEVVINGVGAKALKNSCSTQSNIHPLLMECLGLPKHSEQGNIARAQSSLSAKTLGFCIAYLTLGSKEYTNVHLSIFPGLCADLILGLHFQKQHWSVIFHHGGPQSPSLWPQCVKG